MVTPVVAKPTGSAVSLVALLAFKFLDFDNTFQINTVFSFV